MFDIALQVAAPPPKCTVHSHILNARSAAYFSSVFSVKCSSLTQFHDVNDLVNQFNDLCLAVLDNIAPIRARSRCQSNPSPWVSEDTRQLKTECRRAERQWKKTYLQVQLLHMRELLSSYNLLIKNERLKYFTNLIAAKKYNSRVLFSTIDRIVNPAPSSVPASSVEECNKFLAYFVEKVKGIKASITPPTLFLTPPDVSPTLLSEFTPISLNNLLDIVSHMHLSSCGLDTLPRRLFKEVLHVIAPCLFSTVNECLSSGLFPDYFKHACIAPFKETWP